METNQTLNLEKMHRLEKNILHHAKQRKQLRKYKLNNNTWQQINEVPKQFNHTIKLYEDDCKKIKGIGYY